MKQYLELLNFIMENGETREDRTGTGTQSWFGQQARFNLAEGFPLVTTKKCHLRSIIYELLWFLRGDTNIDYLAQNKVRIWDEWADENGDLGPVYGFQWRHWGAEWPVTDKTPEPMRGIDQIERLVHGLKTDPFSRRHIVSGWNVSNVNAMALPPCHTMFQFYVHGDNRLSCQLYQRSADVFLGVPFNIASYALFTLMLAAQCGMKPGWFVHSFGDLHLYSNHVEQAKLQLSREPRPLPTMKINPDVKSIFDYKFEDFELVGYDPHPGIKAKVAV